MDDLRDPTRDERTTADATAGSHATAGDGLADEPLPGDGGSTGSGTWSADVGPDTTRGREWMTQLQAMIDDVATQAAPVLRQVGAKAAELAAIAAEKAGPAAQKAAEFTADASAKFAEKAHQAAAGLRKDADETGSGSSALWQSDGDAGADDTATPAGTGGTTNP